MCDAVRTARLYVRYVHVRYDDMDWGMLSYGSDVSVVSRRITVDYYRAKTSELLIVLMSNVRRVRQDQE